MSNEESSDRESILSVARKWLPWCLSLIFILTIGWTALIAYTEIASGPERSFVQTFIAIVNGSATAHPAIILYSFLIVTAVDAAGGFIMVTKRYLEEKWLKPQRERLRKEAREKGREEGREEGREVGREEGREVGRAQERQYWIGRERRRLEAEAKGIPFDEPFPGSDEISVEDE